MMKIKTLLNEKNVKIFGNQPRSLTFNKDQKTRGGLSVNPSDFKEPYYAAGDGIEKLKGIARTSKDSKLISMVKKLDTSLDGVYKHLEKNYKGWD